MDFKLGTPITYIHNNIAMVFNISYVWLTWPGKLASNIAEFEVHDEEMAFNYPKNMFCYEIVVST